MNLELDKIEIEEIIDKVYSDYEPTERDTIQERTINNIIQTALLKVKAEIYIKILKNNE